MSPPQDFPRSSSMWFPGLEWLRAIFITFVVSMHLNLAHELANASGHGDGVTVFDVLSNQVFCQAVPGFLLIAVFLQSIRNPEWEVIRAHLVATIFLYAFWVGGWIVWTQGKPQPGLMGLLVYFLKGGGWAFYYFVVLLMVHVVAALTRKLSNRSLWLLLGIALTIVGGAFLGMAAQSHAWTRTETYWWPICFLPVPFVGHLLARHWPTLSADGRSYRLLIACCLFLSIVFGVGEWQLAADASSISMRPFLPEYLRISPLLSALTLILAALKIGSVPKWVSFIARNALGIFCLHVFILRGLHREVVSIVGDSCWSTLVTLVVVLICGAYATEFVRKMFRERLV